MLLAILLFLNMKTMHSVSNAFVDELFSLLWKKLLPKENKMLATSYEAFKLIKSLGLSYDSIHACANGCVFFRGTLRCLQVCPKCGIDGFVDGSKSIPWRVLQHFPLIPRLLRMYRCKSLENLLTWHKDGTSIDGLVRSVVDTLAWKYINDKWLAFATNAHSIRVELAFDGVNPCFVT
jgi:hypothetical protein